MLIDLLLDEPNQHLMNAATRGLMAQAVRFVMQDDFAMAVDQLCRDLPTVNKALTFCRLPFPLCWLEFAAADRDKCSAVAYDTMLEVRPIRIGWLLQQTSDDGSWRADMFWSFNGIAEPGNIGMRWANALGVGHIGASAATAVLCCHADKLKGGDIENGVFELARGFLSDQADIWCKEIMGFEPPVPPGYYSDWQGEPKFIAAALELLNSKNAVERLEVAIPEKLNKRRRRDGKLPFLSYSVLRIPGRYKARHIASGEVTGHQLRAHFVRGHYKVRRTGIYFWSTFQRGNPTLGFVHKDYELRKPT